MTKKEKSFIQTRIVQYRKWAAEERGKARLAMSYGGDAEDERLQERLNESAADTLELLLQELEEI